MDAATRVAMGVEPSATRAGKRTQRYRAKYDMILDAAALLINRHGAQGTTLAAVAAAVGLNTTSITYYFPRKEQLTIACYDRSMDRLDACMDAAEKEATPPARVRAFVAAMFADYRAIREGSQSALAMLTELRTLDEPERTAMMRRYFGIVSRLQAMLAEKDAPIKAPEHVAGANVIMENLLWAPYWLTRYDIADLPRIEARLCDLLIHGIATPGDHWAPIPIDITPPPQEEETVAPEGFLRAATQLINKLGYRGASVERIASERNVTKGSFYHHLDGKDELVLACFRRSFGMVARSQWQAMAVAEAGWPALCTAIAALLDGQLGEESILMRSSALQMLPPKLRAQMMSENNRLARRYSGMLSDGIADGTIRAIDTLIGAQMILATVNSAYDMRWWAERMPAGEATRVYGRILAFGVLPAGS